VIESLVQRLLQWAANRRVVVLAGAAGLAAAAIATLPHLQVETDVLHLLPRSGVATQAFKRYLREFGSLDRVYVMFESPDARPIADFAEPIRAYVDRVRSLVEVRRVDAGLFVPGRDWSYIWERQLLLMDDAMFDAALARFTPAGMRTALDESRMLLALPSGDVKQLVQQDPLGLSRLLRDSLSAGLTMRVDPTEEGLVSRDGRRRLVAIEPTAPPFDTAFSHRLLDRLAAAEAEARATVPTEDEDEPVTLPPAAYAGGYRVAIETEALVRREIVRNTTQSLAAVAVLLALGLRSAPLVLGGAIPIALASALVLAAAATAGVKLAAAASGSSAMLFGLGIDAVILMFLRYREEQAAGVSGADAIARLREPAVSVIFAVVTTAVTFLALLLMDFPSLQELGGLVGTGILVCGALTIVILPALLVTLPPPRHAGGLTTERLGRLVAGARGAILVGAAALTVGLAPGLLRVRLVATLDKLRPPTAASATEATIASSFGVTQDVYLAVAEGPRLESLLEDQQRFAARLRAEAPGVRLQTPVALLPPTQEQDSRARRLDRARLDVDGIRRDLARATVDAGFRPDAFASFDARIARVLDPIHRLSFDAYRQHGLADVLAPLVRHVSGGYITVAYVFPATAAEADAVRRAQAASGGAVTLTGTPVVNRELEERFWPQFRRAIVVGALGVVAFLAMAFRSVRLTVVALLPTLAGLLWALGLIGFAGVELDLFSVFGLLTFLGIGVDYGIHVVHRWRALGDPVAAIVRLGPALLLAGGTTLAGFGTLALSAYPPLRSLGIVLVTTVASALVISLTVVPVLLKGTRR
jgi:uncharacterized protein